MNRRFSALCPRPQYVQLIHCNGPEPEKMESFIFIGSAYTDDQKRSIERECISMSLTTNSFGLIRSVADIDSSVKANTIFRHPLDSTIKIKTTPIFINVYPRTSIERFRMLCSTTLKTNKSLFLWYRNPVEQSTYQAQHLIETHTSGDSLDEALLANDIVFPMGNISPHMSPKDKKALINIVAKRQFTDVCLDSGRCISYFDVDALHYIYRTSVYDSPVSWLPRTLRYSTIYCTDKDTILKRVTESNKKSTVRNYLRVIESLQGTTDDMTKYDTSVYDKMVKDSSSSKFTHEYSVSMSHCHLSSLVPVRRKPLQHIFNTLCLSPQIIASCYSNSDVNIRNFRFYKDPQRPSSLTYSGNEKAMTDWISSMLKYRAETPIWLSFRVLLGQIGTFKTTKCLIDNVGKKAIKVTVQTIQPEDNTVMTHSDKLPFNIAERLFQWNTDGRQSTQTFREWLSAKPKEVQMLTYAKARIYEKNSHGNWSLEFVSGKKKGLFTTIHSSFIHLIDDDTALVVDNISQYATVFVTDKGKVSVIYSDQHTAVTDNLSIPELSSTKRLQSICTSMLSQSPLSDGVVFDSSAFKVEDITKQLSEQSSIFTFVRSLSRPVTIRSCIGTIQNMPGVQEHLKVIPKVLYRRGDTVFYRKSPKSSEVREGIVLGIENISYLVKARDSGKEITVLMDNIDYSWNHASVMTVAPAYVLQPKDIAVQWILWCVLQNMSESETVRTVEKFVGRLKDVQSLIQMTSQSYRDAKKAKDMGIVKLLYQQTESFVDIHNRASMIVLKFVDITDAVERGQLLYVLSYIINASESTLNVAQNTAKTETSVGALSVRKLGLEFDLSDDSESYSDSDTSDEDEKSETIHEDSDREFVQINAKTILERIQKLDSYFLSKTHFRQGYARSCQKRTGNQPLGVSKSEFERIRTSLQQAYKQIYPDKTFTVCSQSNEFNSKEDTCFAVEFRNNYFMCPNNADLLQGVLPILSPEIVNEIESQFVHRNTFVGINSAKAPCCFKKPNKNIIAYMNNTSQSSKRFVYSPYIKEWGHELPSFRFGFCPPTFYTQLNMKPCEQGNITHDSGHNCLLRLGVTQSPNALLSCGAYVCSVLNKPNQNMVMSVNDFKEKLSNIILKLDDDKDRNVLSAFSINDFSEKQNYVEYIQSHVMKDASVCLPLMHRAFSNKCRIVILAFEEDILKVKCSSVSFKHITTEKICIFLETIQHGQRCLDILVNVESKSFQLNKLSSVQCTFGPDDIIQGQPLYDIISKQESSCTRSLLNVRDTQYIDLPSVHDIASIRALSGNISPIQLQDVFGKVSAVLIQYKDEQHVLPIQPSSVDERFEVKRLDKSINPSSAIDAYACIQMVQGELKKMDILPSSTVGTSDTIHYLAFTNGQRVPVAKTSLATFQSVVANIPHIEDVMYDDVQKALERSHTSFLETNVEYAPILDLQKVLNILRSFPTRHNVTPESVYKPDMSSKDMKTVGILTIKTKDDHRCGIHVYIPEKRSLGITKTNQEPVYEEKQSLRLLMDLWRKSKYTLPCRPYRYRMDKAGMYTHLVLENGRDIELQDAVHCNNRLDNQFRSVRLNHIEIISHTNLFFDTRAHRDAYREELLNNLDNEIETEVQRLKPEWTKKKQVKLFAIVNSSNIPQSVLQDVQSLGVSEALALRLLHNPLYIQEWVDPSVCSSNTSVMNSEEAMFWMVHTAIRTRQREYFTNLLNFDTSIQKRNVKKYEYVLQSVNKKYNHIFT